MAEEDASPSSPLDALPAVTRSGVPAPLVHLAGLSHMRLGTTASANRRTPAAACGDDSTSSTTAPPQRRRAATASSAKAGPMPTGDADVCASMAGYGLDCNFVARENMCRDLHRFATTPASCWGDAADDMVWLVVRPRDTLDESASMSPLGSPTTSSGPGATATSASAAGSPGVAQSLASRIEAAFNPRRVQREEEGERQQRQHQHAVTPMAPVVAGAEQSSGNADAAASGGGDESSGGLKIVESTASGGDLAAASSSRSAQLAPIDAVAAAAAQPPPEELIPLIAEGKAVVFRRSRDAKAPEDALLPEADNFDEDSARDMASVAKVRELVDRVHAGEPRLLASLALNISCQWVYTLTVAVVRAMPVKELYGDRSVMVAVRHTKRRIFASPYKSATREKAGHHHGGDHAQQTSYPYLHFNLDDFESEFGGTKIGPGYHFAVLLTAGDTSDHTAAVFRGVVAYADVVAHLRRKQWRPPYAAAASCTGPSPPVPGSPTNIDDGSVAFIPLAAKAGRSEVAVTVTEADRKPAPPPRSVTQRVLGFFSSPKEPAPSSAPTQQQDSGAAGGGLDGNETLECSLTHLSLHVGHVITVILRGAEETSSTGRAGRPWLVIPPSGEVLSRWLVEDEERRSRRAPAAAQ